MRTISSRSLMPASSHAHYYYVEVWHFARVDVVFEEADLAQFERAKEKHPRVVHDLVFHPNARLASTWQARGSGLQGARSGHEARGNGNGRPRRIPEPPVLTRSTGGPDRDRTGDLLNAI